MATPVRSMVQTPLGIKVFRNTLIFALRED